MNASCFFLFFFVILRQSTNFYQNNWIITIDAVIRFAILRKDQFHVAPSKQCLKGGFSVGFANKNHDFDLKLAIECAEAFSSANGLGCTLSDNDGAVLYDAGYNCSCCKICKASGMTLESCMQAQAYGMSESERFGGKYIYFCPMGLTCFVSPIMGQYRSTAKITVGPFLMVDREDYIVFDLEERLKLDNDAIDRVLAITDKLNAIPASKVNALSTLLFMALGFINNVSAANHMLEIQGSGAMQSQITEYIMELKAIEKPPEYPVRTEKALLSSIIGSEKQEAQKLLNELLGHIFFSTGGNFSEIQLRIYELLALISRAAMDVGASPSETFRMNHTFYLKAASTTNLDELCFFLAELINQYIDRLFTHASVKNADVINKALHYIRQNCDKKLTLDDVAKTVLLSPTYFSKILKQETRKSFNEHLNNIRIEKSKRLLLQTSLFLVDIASISGFEDQSYFTKVFKKITGISPNKYRRSGGRLESGNKIEQTI